MMSYTRFTKKERESRKSFKKAGLNIREMARRLDRSPSSISREFKRNSNKDKTYNHWRAYILYKARKRKNNRRKLHPETPAWNYIVEHLNQFWSPEQVVMRYERVYGKKPISVKTLYNYISRGEFPGVSKRESFTIIACVFAHTGNRFGQFKFKFPHLKTAANLIDFLPFL